MTKSSLMIGGSTAALLFATAGIAFAAEMMNDGGIVKDKMTSTSAPSSMMMMHPPAPMILTVSPEGMGRIRGVVSAVGANSLTVAGWGGMWTINITSSTKVTPDLGSIKVGDYVGAMGSISEDGPTMTADIVRKWETKKDMKGAMKDGIHDDKMKGGLMKDDHKIATGTGAMMHQ